MHRAEVRQIAIESALVRKGPLVVHDVPELRWECSAGDELEGTTEHAVDHPAEVSQPYFEETEFRQVGEVGADVVVHRDAVHACAPEFVVLLPRGGPGLRANVEGGAETRAVAQYTPEFVLAQRPVQQFVLVHEVREQAHRDPQLQHGRVGAVRNGGSRSGRDLGVDASHGFPDIRTIVVVAEDRDRQIGAGGPGAFHRMQVGSPGVHRAVDDTLPHPRQGQLHDHVRHVDRAAER